MVGRDSRAEHRSYNPFAVGYLLSLWDFLSFLPKLAFELILVGAIEAGGGTTSEEGPAASASLDIVR